MRINCRKIAVRRVRMHCRSIAVAKRHLLSLPNVSRKFNDQTILVSKFITNEEAGARAVAI